MKRIESLDYLRGLLAVAVMVYHYTAWSVGPLGADEVLGRIGIYGVSTFYILSGLSLALVYDLRSRADVADFAVKRIFRIAPLFWVVVTLGILTASRPAPFREILLNYTLTFGFLDPDAYFTVGAWSIGNEMVFYALFPLILLTQIRWWVIGSLVVAAWFAWIGMDPSISLKTQWATYVSPMNQLFLFVAGVAVARGNAWYDWSKPALLSVLVLAASVFALYPIRGHDSAVLVSGLNRFVLSGSCVAFVLALYRLAPEFRGAIGRVLSFLGRGSYSIYLLHPLVSRLFVSRGSKGEAMGYVLAAACTLLISALSYRYLEQPAMRFGRALTRRAREDRLSADDAA